MINIEEKQKKKTLLRRVWQDQLEELPACSLQFPNKNKQQQQKNHKL